MAMLPLRAQEQPGQRSDTNRIRSHLQTITAGNFRLYTDTARLNEVAEYITGVFRAYTDSVWVQTYTVEGRIFRNVVCSFGTAHKERIVVGAHYDVCGLQQGADDNASGTVGLLELARLLHGRALGHRIDLVAYSTEEPPYFGTKHMGSYVHAKYLHDNRADVKGMLALEMIGYFSDAKKSQTYPLGVLSLFYGRTGDYITLVRKYGSGRFARKFCRAFKDAGTIRTRKFTAPAFVQGIDWSDHVFYWYFGYSALMVTDTSFYRNKNYHQPTDRLETLDLHRMAKVIDGVLLALLGNHG